MSWTGLTSNQFVSFKDAAGCGLAILHTLPTTDQIMTKADLVYYFSGFNPANITALADNQWISKSHFSV